MNRDVTGSIVDRGSAPDWIIIALGALLSVVSIVTDGIPTWWGLLLGLLTVAAGVWDMLTPSDLGVAAEALSGVVTFLLPWIAGFSGAGGAWFVWGLGILIIASAAWSWASHPTSSPDGR